MHAIAGNIRNMKHKGLPLLTMMAQPTYGRAVNLHRIRRRAAHWLFELLDDPEPVVDTHIQLSKDSTMIETHLTYAILARINTKLAEQGSGVWRFTGFDANGDPNYHWRDV
jgi:hypothetical protein